MIWTCTGPQRVSVEDPVTVTGDAGGASRRPSSSRSTVVPAVVPLVGPWSAGADSTLDPPVADSDDVEVW